MGSLADREKRRSVVGSMVSEMPKTEVEYKNPTYKVRVDTFRKVKMKALEEGKHDYEIRPRLHWTPILRTDKT